MRKESLIVRTICRTSLLSPGACALALFAGACGGTDDPEPAAGVGDTYLLEISPDDWTPAAVGSEVGEFVPQFLIKVNSLEDGQAELLVGTANGGVQEECSPTGDIPGVGETVPEIVAGPAELPIYIVNPNEANPDDGPVKVLATIQDFTFAGVLPDGSGTGEGTLTVTMDMRELYPLFTQILSPSPEAVCGALESLEAACTACSDGELFCLTMTANYLEATKSDNEAMEILEADIPATCLD